MSLPIEKKSAAAAFAVLGTGLAGAAAGLSLWYAFLNAFTAPLGLALAAYHLRSGPRSVGKNKVLIIGLLLHMLGISILVSEYLSAQHTQRWRPDSQKLVPVAPDPQK